MYNVTQKRFLEAEPLALAAYEGYRKALGENHQDTRQVVEQIVKLYTEAGQTERAEPWRAKLLRQIGFRAAIA